MVMLTQRDGVTEQLTALAVVLAEVELVCFAATST
jgi:hypothetical protein